MTLLGRFGRLGKPVINPAGLHNVWRGGTAMLGRADATNRVAGSSLASGYKLVHCHASGKVVSSHPLGGKPSSPCMPRPEQQGVLLLPRPDLSADKTPILVAFC